MAISLGIYPTFSDKPISQMDMIYKWWMLMGFSWIFHIYMREVFILLVSLPNFKYNPRVFVSRIRKNTGQQTETHLLQKFIRLPDFSKYGKQKHTCAIWLWVQNLVPWWKHTKIAGSDMCSMLKRKMNLCSAALLFSTSGPQKKTNS